MIYNYFSSNYFVYIHVTRLSNHTFRSTLQRIKLTVLRLFNKTINNQENNLIFSKLYVFKKWWITIKRFEDFISIWLQQFRFCYYGSRCFVFFHFIRYFFSNYCKLCWIGGNAQGNKFQIQSNTSFKLRFCIARYTL